MGKTGNFYEFKESYFANFLKQIFLFLPGALFLYFISFLTTITFWDIFSRQRSLFSVLSSEPFSFLLLLIFFSIGILMTWLGLGKLKNVNHLIIPTLIIISGAIAGIIFGNPKNSPNLIAGILFTFRKAILLFPLVLIIPILVKKWIDKKAE